MNEICGVEVSSLTQVTKIQFGLKVVLKDRESAFGLILWNISLV